MLGVLEHIAGNVVMDFIVEGTLAVDFEADHDERERDHGVGLHVCVGVTLDPDGEEDDKVGQDGGEDHAVVEHTPEHAAGLGLGDEDVEEEVFLQVNVQHEVQSAGQETERLDGGVAEGDCAVKEEVIVVCCVLECGWSRQFDQFPRCRTGEFPSAETPQQRPQLRQVNSGTEISLQQPGNPEGRNVA